MVWFCGKESVQHLKSRSHLDRGRVTRCPAVHNGAFGPIGQLCLDDFLPSRSLLTVQISRRQARRHRITFYRPQKMREFEAPYGVPLQPFPAGSNWSTTHDMIEMLFSDLRQPWVQNFVLRSDPKQDVAALTDPKNYLRAISLSYSGKSIPQLSGGFESSSFHVRLNIPVFTVGDIGVGLGVECSDAGGAVFSKSDQFFRSVFNNRRHSQLNVRVLDGEGKIEAGFQYYSESGFWQYCILVFDELQCRGPEKDARLGRRKTTSIRPNFTRKGYPYLDRRFHRLDARRWRF